MYQIYYILRDNNHFAFVISKDRHVRLTQIDTSLHTSIVRYSVSLTKEALYIIMKK